MKPQKKITRALLDYIRDNKLHVGDKLPSERDLAAFFSISRNTLRESTGVLSDLGILEIRHGSGIYVLQDDFVFETNGPKWLKTHKTDVLDVLVVRECLELKAIELIPPNERNTVGEQLLACINRIDIMNCNYQDLFYHDMAFHSIIRNASHNPILIALCNEISDTVYDERPALFSESGQILRSLSEHSLIADAFIQGDLDKMKQCCSNHYQSTQKAVLNVISANNT